MTDEPTSESGDLPVTPGASAEVEATSRWRAVGREVLGGVGPYGLALLVLAAIYPYAVLLDANQRELELDGRLVGLAAITLAIALLVTRLTIALRPRAAPDRVAAVVSFLTVWSFSFSTAIPEGLRTDHQAVALALWAMVAAIGGILISRVTRSATGRQFVGLFLGFLALVPAATYGIAQLDSGDDPRAAAADEVLLPGAVPADEVDDLARPNIYWFMPDEYARADQMATVVGFDNSAMLDDLRARGFTIGEETYASYTITALSLAAVLSMDYPAETDADLAEGPFPYAATVRGDSAVADELRRLGYRTAYAEAGPFAWATCDAAVVDVCLQPISEGLALDEFESTLLDMTPLGLFEVGGQLHTTPTDALDKLYAELDPSDDAPFFFLAHILSPHYPYRHGAGCEPLGYTSPLLDRELYANDVRCLNAQLLEAVDRIIEVDPTAVIIIQSDHGTKFTLEGGPVWNDEQVRDRLAVLDARRLPAGCEGPGDGPAATVNTFRELLGCIEGRDFPLLDYRGFTIWWSDLTSIEEIDPPW